VLSTSDEKRPVLLRRGARDTQRYPSSTAARVAYGAPSTHGNAAGELGNTFLELLSVVVRRGFFSLLADRLDTRLDVRRLAGAVDEASDSWAFF